MLTLKNTFVNTVLYFCSIYMFTTSLNSINKALLLKECNKPFYILNASVFIITGCLVIKISQDFNIDV